MMLLNLFRRFSARRGPPVQIKVSGVRIKLFSHPLSPRTLPSTVCEAGANKGATGADEDAASASRVILHRTFFCVNYF